MHGGVGIGLAAPESGKVRAVYDPVRGQERAAVVVGHSGEGDQGGEDVEVHGRGRDAEGGRGAGSTVVLCHRDGGVGVAAHAARGIARDEGHFHAALEGGVLSPSQRPRSQRPRCPLAPGTVVRGEDDDGVVVEGAAVLLVGSGTEIVEDPAQLAVELLYAVDIAVVRGIPLPVVVVVGKDGVVRPRRGVEGEEGVAALDGGGHEGEHLVREEEGAFGLVEVFGVSAHFGVGHALRVSAARVPHPVVGRHIVDVIAAVEIVKTLVGGQIFAVVSEVPLAYARGVVARSLQHFRKGHLVAEDAVHVEEELIGVEEVGGGPRVAVRDGGEDHVVEIAAGGISARQHRETRGGTHGRRGVEILHHHAVLRDGIDVGGVDGGSPAREIAVRRDVRIRHVVHEYDEDVRRRALLFGGDGGEIGVMPLPQPVHHGAGSQVHEEGVYARRRDHEGEHRARNAFERLAVQEFAEEDEQHRHADGSEQQHEVPPQPFAE